ncbi:MAG: D-alanyl-D-alanine carboxypeptidase [Lachnospiraceae bacterium]|nr:D-alanyl-D-alanine carboxypeptidase [Lachnospiraceae bacterium]
MALLVVSGCGQGGIRELSDTYPKKSVYSASMDRWESSGRTGLFSEGLCVVEDEGSFLPEGFACKAAALFDLTDKEVLYSRNAFVRLPPASITKIMTAYVAIKYGDLSKSVTITQEAMVTDAGATLAGLQPGEVYTLEQLLYALMLPSGNDAACAIALAISGSLDAFVDRMNAEALSLGATQTTFKNPHGLTAEGHVTTAYDLYLIFSHALGSPQFRKLIHTTTYTAVMTDASGNTDYRNWSGGNWYMTGNRETPEGLSVYGGKTGTTNAAGYCLIINLTDASGGDYIAVVLGADSREGLYDDMTELMEKIFTG